MRKKLYETGSKTPRVLLALWIVLLLLVAQSANVGVRSTAFAAVPTVVGGRAVIINTGGDAIRVRQGAGTQYPQVSAVYEGQIVSILAGPSSDAQGKSWFKVQTPAGTGWITAAFLQGTSALPPSLARKLHGSARVASTDGDPLRVRQTPAASAGVLTLLDPGTTVAVQAGPLTDSTGVLWYQIAAGGSTGWVMAQYLAQAETTQTPNQRATATATRTVPATKSPLPVRASTTAKPTAAKPAVAKPTATVVPTATAKPAEKPAAQRTVVATQVVVASGATTTLAQYHQWMEDARTAFPYTQSVDKMWSVMMCESGGNTHASGGGGAWLGLFQYSPGTWAGSWNPYRSNSIWDAKSQIFATAKAWSLGMQGAWSCY